MKLIHCLDCGDVVMLLNTPRSCECGKSEGLVKRAPSGQVAELWGPCVPLAFGNESFKAAVAKVVSGTQYESKMFNAFVLHPTASTIRHQGVK